jgi:hypothetical protein
VSCHLEHSAFRKTSWLEFSFSARQVLRVRVETRIAAPKAVEGQNSPSPADGLQGSRALSLLSWIDEALTRAFITERRLF